MRNRNLSNEWIIPKKAIVVANNNSQMKFHACLTLQEIVPVWIFPVLFFLKPFMKKLDENENKSSGSSPKE